MYDLLKEYFSDKEEYNIEIEDNYFYIENLTENSGNKFTALKLEYVKSSLDSDLDVDVYDESGNVIGFLCLLKEKEKEIASLTESQYVAYFNDNEDLINYGSSNYIFKNNYLIVKFQYLHEYLSKYYESSMIWGGFSHKSLSVPIYKKTINSIYMKSDIVIPTEFNKDSLIKATASKYHFERFLKYYHQLELLFNYVHVCKLKNAGNNLSTFNKIVSNYNREDIRNITTLIDEYVDDITIIENIINQAHFYLSIIQDIFFDYGKDSNPLKDEIRWNKFKQLLIGQKLNFTEAKNLGLANNQNDFKSFILKIISYWIYRIRSSIAHNKIGEFILEESHQSFLVEVGEEILLEVIKQIFSSEKFKNDTQSFSS
jgi:hypothetical protein